jgi:hypothetical protein
MTIHPTFLLIADIGGYTRFMNFHRTSLAHAQDVVARLLEAVIDAARGHLKLAKLEGDAAFFYATYRPGVEPDLGFIAEQSAAIFRAFHDRASQIRVNTFCRCDGCQQAGNLKIKLVGHFGEAAMQRIKALTELAGVDVILVHRLLKNTVPVPEYLLMTEPVHRRVADAIRERAASLELELEGLGPTPAYYMDLERYVGEVPPSPRRSLGARFLQDLGRVVRSLPAMLGLTEACRDFRNIDRTGAG